MSEFELKLMDITSENLGIPDTEYSATVRPPIDRLLMSLASVGSAHRSQSARGDLDPRPPVCACPPTLLLPRQVSMPSGEFMRIMKDLGSIGDTGALPLPHRSALATLLLCWV